MRARYTILVNIDDNEIKMSCLQDRRKYVT